jgi:hypothetical protein
MIAAHHGGGTLDMPSLENVIQPWYQFYSLLGAASATMVALLFVTASIAGGVFTPNRRAPLRVFLSATVVHFSSILAASLVVLAPVHSRVVLSPLLLACGMFGLVYSVLTWRETVRDGLSASIDLEDRIWYVLLPIVCYLFEIGAGALMLERTRDGCISLAVAMSMLLVIAIHNAWDITVWTITRRRE